MRMCTGHWTKLRKAIDDRGLTHLVPNSGEEAVKLVAKGNLDPLMDAHMRIAKAAVRDGGTYLLKGDYCPLCELDKVGEKSEDKPMSDNWINGCCDDVLNDNKGQLN